MYCKNATDTGSSWGRTGGDDGPLAVNESIVTHVSSGHFTLSRANRDLRFATVVRLSYCVHTKESVGVGTHTGRVQQRDTARQAEEADSRGWATKSCTRVRCKGRAAYLFDSATRAPQEA